VPSVRPSPSALHRHRDVPSPDLSHLTSAHAAAPTDADRLRQDVARRLARVCADMTPDAFRELVTVSVDRRLRWAREDAVAMGRGVSDAGRADHGP
jgi:hypothetical protein